VNDYKVPVKVSASNIIAPVKATTSRIAKRVRTETAINVIHEDTEIYEGEYVVTPKFYEETILETQDKKMEENV
jgi:Trk K+ transport system NAD-binding subunit